MDFIKRLKKLKKRNLLVLSASAVNNGLELLQIELQNDSQWSIIHSEVLKYPKNIEQFLNRIYTEPEATIAPQELMAVDHSMSFFLAESGLASISALPKTKQNIHAVIIKNFILCKDLIHPQRQPKHWLLPIGDMQIVAQMLQKPVLTDFIRTNILIDDQPVMPVMTGDIHIGRKAGNTAVLVHLGHNSRMTIIDCSSGTILLDSDSSPGTMLINMAAHQAGCTEGFDRDGSS
ncbi:MAG: anhydro-N-acetylmuramic acid kinase, partial [Chitinivibrionales bacterium]|nr:anhydro-N-acetylmuramic acid kinase [Chitinivibrionales bacterium]